MVLPVRARVFSSSAFSALGARGFKQTQTHTHTHTRLLEMKSPSRRASCWLVTARVAAGVIEANKSTRRICYGNRSTIMSMQK